MRGRKGGLKASRSQPLVDGLGRPIAKGSAAARERMARVRAGKRPRGMQAALSPTQITEQAQASRQRRINGDQSRAGGAERAEAFRLYLLDHSTASIAKTLGLATSTILSWAKAGRWASQRETCFSNAEARVLRFVEEKNEDSIKRHNVIAVEMQRKGMEYLSHTPPETLGEVIRLLETGVKIERAGRGLDAKGDPMDKLVDGLLSGDIIAAAVEKRRVLLARAGPPEAPTVRADFEVTTSVEEPSGTTREETPPTP